MKQVFVNFRRKKLIGAALVSASVLLTSLAAHAQQRTEYMQPAAVSKSDIQFTGSSNDGFFLKLHVNNEAGCNCTLTVKGDNGEVLYSRTFSEKEFSQQFKLMNDESVISSYYFTITSADKEMEATYVVNPKTRTAYDVAINKL